MRRSRRTRPRFRRAGQVALGVLLVPIGFSHLAHNTVPVTSAGAVDQQVVVPTHLVRWGNERPDVTLLRDRARLEFSGVAALLTNGGTPFAGQTVTFSAADIWICTAVTDQRGVARCPRTAAPTSVFHGAPHRVTASFEGNGAVEPATVTFDTDTRTAASVPSSSVHQTTGEADGTMVETDAPTQEAGTDG